MHEFSCHITWSSKKEIINIFQEREKEILADFSQENENVVTQVYFVSFLVRTDGSNTFLLSNYWSKDVCPSLHSDPVAESCLKKLHLMLINKAVKSTFFNIKNNYDWAIQLKIFSHIYRDLSFSLLIFLAMLSFIVR